MSKPTRAAIRQRATQQVELYSATLAIDNNASVRKGTKKHLDPDLEPTEGWWVDCKIFVPREADSE